MRQPQAPPKAQRVTSRGNDISAPRSEIARTMSLEQLRYSQVWEDHLLIERGLQITGSDDVLSIGSAGDNALALLLAGAHSVAAIDMSPAQNALLELKVAAVESINEHADFIAFLGLAEDTRRLERFDDTLLAQLGDDSRLFWHTHRQWLAEGVVHCGRLERYISVFRDKYLTDLWPEDLRQRMFHAGSLDEQSRLFMDLARHDAFDERFRWYFGREMMAEQGRDPVQFSHVDVADVGAYFLDRFTTACTSLPLHSNPYLWMFLCGESGPLEHATPYLRPDNYGRLRGLVGRLTIVQAELEQYLDSQPNYTFNKANLSDVFEYMDAEHAGMMFAALARSLRPGGRFAYWNLLVKRQPPPEFRNALRSCDEEAEALWRTDRAWFYRSFHVEEVLQ